MSLKLPLITLSPLYKRPSGIRLGNRNRVQTTSLNCFYQTYELSSETWEGPLALRGGSKLEPPQINVTIIELIDDYKWLWELYPTNVSNPSLLQTQLSVACHKTYLSPQTNSIPLRDELWKLGTIQTRKSYSPRYPSIPRLYTPSWVAPWSFPESCHWAFSYSSKLSSS